MKVAILPVLLLSLCSATPSLAQTFANVRVDGMPTIYVTDRNGEETKGKLLKWTDSSVVVQGEGGTRAFDIGEVALIERRDGLRNGTIIGALVGAPFAIMAGGSADCPGGCGAGTRIGLGLLGLGVYAALGAGIDAVIPGRSKMWPGPPRRAGNVTVKIDPVRRGAFVGWSVR